MRRAPLLGGGVWRWYIVVYTLIAKSDAAFELGIYRASEPHALEVIYVDVKH